MPLHVSSTVVLFIRRSKLYYTAFCIATLCWWPFGARVERGPQQVMYCNCTTPLGRPPCTEPQCLHSTAMGHTVCTEPRCLYSTAIPLLPLWAVRSVQSLRACTRAHFTLFYVDWNDLSQNGDRCRAVVNTIMNYRAL